MDALANGSGFVKMLTDKDKNTQKPYLNILLDKIVNFKGRYMQSIKSHANECSASCVKCLQTYQNAGYHHILDWRLGMDIIKLMLDSSYVMGKEDYYDTPYGDLFNQFKLATDKVKGARPDLKINQDFSIESTTGARIKEKVVHPLWMHDKNHDQNLFDLLRCVYNPKVAGRITGLPTPNGNPSSVPGGQQGNGQNGVTPGVSLM